jgi:hypothetical protein
MLVFALFVSLMQLAPCGKTGCPSGDYICCAQEEDAPAECCLKAFAGCYHGGGTFTGWPVYNGCNPFKCKKEKPKLCKGSTRNTCCKADQTCETSWGVSYCKDRVCAENRLCNDERLCCSRPGICREFRNIEYCAEPCEERGKVRCKLIGKYYGKQPFHLCCPKGTCTHHPDGWPFCLGEVN